jgi:hypothetical protein
MFDEELRKKLIKNFSKFKIDRSKKVEYPPVALSVGEISIGQTIYPIPFGTYGNFSALVGGTKVGKSFFKSLVTASYIGGDANKYAPSFKTFRESDKYILDFDTEQGEWHAQMGAKRVDKITGGSYENYKPFMLRELDFQERVEFIEYCLFEKFKNNVGFVFIDGIADLISDVNSLQESNEIIQKLMMWSSKTKSHINVVIHSNYGSNKATGHLGSAINKKAETVCQLERDGDYTKVTFPFCRGFKADDFKFTLDTFGLPHIEDLEF